MLTAVVTGGAQGIGQAIARRLLTHGYEVVLAEKDGQAGREAVAELKLAGPVRYEKVDVSNPAEVKDLFRSLSRLDALVNNAGISKFTPFEKLTYDGWLEVLGVNLGGVFLCAQAATPLLRKHHGAIVNIASTRALQSEPNTEAYAASKGGVVALTHALAMTLGPTIRVNCISPGWIDVSPLKKKKSRHPVALKPRDHAQHPVGRVGTPDDIAALTAWLLGPEAGFITAANFIVDGGMTRKMIYIED